MDVKLPFSREAARVSGPSQVYPAAQKSEGASGKQRINLMGPILDSQAPGLQMLQLSGGAGSNPALLRA